MILNNSASVLLLKVNHPSYELSTLSKPIDISLNASDPLSQRRQASLEQHGNIHQLTKPSSADGNTLGSEDVVHRFCVSTDNEISNIVVSVSDQCNRKCTNANPTVSNFQCGRIALQGLTHLLQAFFDRGKPDILILQATIAGDSPFIDATPKSLDMQYGEWKDKIHDGHQIEDNCKIIG